MSPATKQLHREALAALGATCVDNSATATGFHANEETVRACAANFGRLIRAFHVEFLTDSVCDSKSLRGILNASCIALMKISAAFDYRKFSLPQQHLTIEIDSIALSYQDFNQNVDKLLII